jgi:hypothetical protein
MKEITVKQFIAVMDILQDEFYVTETDRDVALLACLTGKPEAYFLEMKLNEFKAWKNKLEVIDLDSIEAKAPKHLKVNGKTYAPIFDFRKLSAGQFVDVTTFCKDPEEIINNLPKILASLCVPTKRGLFGYKLQPYLSVEHEEVANDMLEASIIDAYGIALFFWAVWKGSLEITGDSLVREILKKKEATKTPLTKNETAGLLHILNLYGDGITAQKK